MNRKEATELFIVLMTAVIIGYDLFVLLSWGEPYTISAVIRDWAAELPLVKPLILSTMLTLFWHLFLK